METDYNHSLRYDILSFSRIIGLLVLDGILYRFREDSSYRLSVNYKYYQIDVFQWLSNFIH